MCKRKMVTWLVKFVRLFSENQLKSKYTLTNEDILPKIRKVICYNPKCKLLLLGSKTLVQLKKHCDKHEFVKGTTVIRFNGQLSPLPQPLFHPLCLAQTENESHHSLCVFFSPHGSHLILLSLNSDHLKRTGFYYGSYKSLKGCTVSHDQTSSSICAQSIKSKCILWVPGVTCLNACTGLGESDFTGCASRFGKKPSLNTSITLPVLSDVINSEADTSFTIWKCIVGKPPYWTLHWGKREMMSLHF